MANTLYELLIRFDDTGNYRGAHALDRDPATGAISAPRPIHESDWPSIAVAVNASTLAALGELDIAKSEAEMAKAAAEAKHGELLALAASGDIETIKAKAEEQKLSERDLEVAKLKARLRELGEDVAGIEGIGITIP